MLLKNKLIVVAIVLSLFAGIAFGATPPSSSHVKKVEQLLDVVHFDELMENQIDMIVNTLTQQSQFAAHKTEIKKLFSEIMNEETLKKDMIAAYVNTFTEDEIEEMIKFNQSPLGQKMQKKLPELTQHLMGNMQKNMAKNHEKVQAFMMNIALKNKENKQ